MRYITTLLLLLPFIVSCSKDNNGGSDDPDKPFIFSALIAEKDTIESGESTKITATATGYKINYYWAATAGDILGSGHEVLYTASPCQVGKNKITCTVCDGNNVSESKEIFIVVK
jgi:hypothetical protein